MKLLICTYFIQYKKPSAKKKLSPNYDRLGGRNINNIRYADNTVLISDSEEKLQRLVEVLSEECRSFGSSVNITKTKMMGLTKRREQLEVNVTLEGGVLEQVCSFRYLRSLVCEEEKL